MKSRETILETTAKQPAIDLQDSGFLRDLLLTLAAALWTGLAGSALFILLVVAMTGGARAATDDVTRGQLARYSLDGSRIDDAPLLHTDVQVHISGMQARVRVQQRFNNPDGVWLEGIYRFPLPQDSAVDRLRLRIGERFIEGEIQERRQAKADYDKAKAAGKRASLLSQERPNIFTISVANIGPGEMVQVEIEYQQRLDYDQGDFHLRFPLVVGPRYIPGVPVDTDEGMLMPGNGWGQDTDAVPDASRITSPVADPLHGPINPLSLSIHLDAGVELQAIHSLYHAMVYQQDDRGVYHLSLKDREVPTDRDFELVWTPRSAQNPQAALFAERWQDEDYALLMLLPPTGQPVSQGQPRELVFVIDTSGSMHGASIEQARRALQLALARLNLRDRFNVIQFNNHTQALFDQAMPATAHNLQRALGYVSALQAQGGTEMLPALRRALEHADGAARLRQIVFLTDGSVGNEAELFALIEHRLGDSRLFTVGIGSAPNSYFMRRAAEFGRGSFTYISAPGEVKSRMEKLFLKLEDTALTDIRLHWRGGAMPEHFPPRVPDLYRGEPLWLVLKGDALPDELRIEGRRGDSVWRQSLRLQPGAGQSGVHSLWARRKIAHLMGESNRGRPSEAVSNEVLQLALEHRLVSRYTSLVAVDKTPARGPTEDFKSRAMPTNLPQGWTASKVFGRLPQTATDAPVQLLSGLGLCLLALVLWLGLRRHEGVG